MIFLIRTATNCLFYGENAVVEVMYSSNTLVVLLVSAIAEKERFAENMHVSNWQIENKNRWMEVVELVSEWVIS